MPPDEARVGTITSRSITDKMNNVLETSRAATYKCEELARALVGEVPSSAPLKAVPSDSTIKQPMICQLEDIHTELSSNMTRLHELLDNIRERFQ